MENYEYEYNYENEKNKAQDVNFIIVDNKKPENKKSKGRGRLALFIVILLVSNISAGLLGGFFALELRKNSFDYFGAPSQINDTTSKLKVEQADDAALHEGKLSTEDIVKMNENSIVDIQAEKINKGSWFGSYMESGAGSGVIVSPDGYIITNNHVVENASKIVVRLKNQKTYDAELIGHDAESDLAVIKINEKNLNAVVYGNSKDVKVGQISLIIGNPLGKLGGTVTLGIISAVDRNITIDGHSMSLIQTDASVNPGNSGGGMFNDKGQLIGIVVAKTGGANVEGLGFAIPVDKVKAVAKDLAQYGYVKGRPATGMTYIDLTNVQDAIIYSVPNLGIYIKSVDSEAAKKAGFQKGDMVFFVDKIQIKSFEDLLKALENKKVGETVEYKVIRDDSIVTINLVLGEKTQ